MPSEITVGAGPRRTHPLTVVAGFAAVAVGTLLDFALGTGGIDFVLQLFGGLSILRWFFTTYDVGPDELVVRGGVLFRREQTVPYRRVQQIDVKQGLLMQLFRLGALRIETAGSQAGTVDLRLLDLPTADALRAFVLSRRDAAHAAAADSAVAPPVPAWSVPPAPVLEISAGRALLAGLTSPLPVVAGAVGIVLAFPTIAFAVAGDGASFVVPLVFVPIFVAIAVVSSLASVLLYGGYRLSLEGDDLRLQHGVLERRQVTMPRVRVQHVSITDNPAQRALGFASVHIRSAAKLGGSQSSRLDIPLIERERIPTLLATLMGDASWTPPALEPRPPAARRRGTVRRTAALTVPALVALSLAPLVGVLAFACALAAGIAWGRSAHRRAGHCVTPSTVAVAAGVVSHRLHLVPITRVQSARTQQSLFQRRARLATMSFDIAGSSSAASLYDADGSTARELLIQVPLASTARLSSDG